MKKAYSGNAMANGEVENIMWWKRYDRVEEYLSSTVLWRMASLFLPK
jgi:hypothetical protein